MQVYDPRELNELIALASRGGLGTGVALVDCVAEQPDQLMYIAGDELILLRDLGSILLASCEGVIGWVRRQDVKFESLASSSTPSSPTGKPIDLPRTTLTAPSPPPRASSPRESAATEAGEEEEDTLSPRGLMGRESKRISGPFELDSPQSTPGLEKAGQQFFQQQQGNGHSPLRGATEGRAEPVRDEDKEEEESTKRESVTSIASSAALGGIGGFMMGSGEEDSESGHDSLGDTLEELRDDTSPAATSIRTPFSSQPSSSPPRHPPSPVREAGDDKVAEEADEDGDWDEEDDSSEHDWDIYNDYARESMYAPAMLKRISMAQKRASRVKSEAESVTPKANGRSSPSETPGGTIGAGSLATQLRLRIQREREKESHGMYGDEGPLSPPVIVEPPEQPGTERMEAVDARPAFRVTMHDYGETSFASSAPDEEEEKDEEEVAVEASPTEAKEPENDGLESPVVDDKRQESTLGHGGREDSEESTILETPRAKSEERMEPREPVIIEPMALPRQSDESTTLGPLAELSSPPNIQEPPTKPPALRESQLLASPLPLDDAPVIAAPPAVPNHDPSHDTDFNPTNPLSPPQLFPRHAPSLSPNLAASSPKLSPAPSPTPRQHPWTPGSPASPHSIAATQQAVAASATPEGKRPRGLTLVGRMERDLSAATGPVPITFTIGGPGAAPPPLPTSPGAGSIGLGLPGVIRSSSPLSSPLAPPPLLDTIDTVRAAPSRFPSTVRPASPAPNRSVTSPIAPTPPSNSQSPKPGFFPRPRSRSFGAAMAKAVGLGNSSSGGHKTPPVPLRIQTPGPAAKSTPELVSPPPRSASSQARPFVARKATAPAELASFASSSSTATTSKGATHKTPPASPKKALSPSKTTSQIVTLPLQPPENLTPTTGTTASQAPASARSSSFSFKSTPPSLSLSINGRPPTNRKFSTASTRVLPSPVSHKDFYPDEEAETVKADGMDFEIIQPRKPSSSAALLSPSSMSITSDAGGDGDLTRSETFRSMESKVSAASSGGAARVLVDTDEWGFVKERSPVPEIFQGRSQGGETRALEQKWLTIISTPLPSSNVPPKKVRKLVLEAGLPASLRGRVWAWFMSSQLSARVPGLYDQLLEHEARCAAGEDIDRDVAGAWSDHSIFHLATSPGRTDLRQLLRAYSNFATSGYRPEMCLLAGMLLIHSPAEEAFWLLSGLVNGVMREVYQRDGMGMRVMAGVFWRVLQGSEKDLATRFKEVGLQASDVLGRWYTQMFIRCLPWPTALRVVDAVVSEGPRFLLITALTILTLSKERLLALPRTKAAVLSYLHDLPPDGLLVPEGFMKAAARVKVGEDDWKKLREGALKDIESGKA